MCQFIAIDCLANLSLLIGLAILNAMIIAIIATAI